MTLDEFITYFEEQSKEHTNLVPYDIDKKYRKNCKRLAEWLKELERYRKVRRILSQNRIATDRYGEMVLWDDIKRILTEVQDADSN
jgi:hypothetical protein